MSKERVLLRNLKASHKAELTELKHYIREMSRRCKQHKTHKDHAEPDLTKAKHDAEYYKGQIKDITARLKEMSAK